jgi:hypothetical protein
METLADLISAIARALNSLFYGILLILACLCVCIVYLRSINKKLP